MIERDEEKFEVDLLFSFSAFHLEVFFLYDDRDVLTKSTIIFVLLLHGFLEIPNHVTKLEPTLTSARGVQTSC